MCLFIITAIIYSSKFISKVLFISIIYNFMFLFVFYLNNLVLENTYKFQLI